MKRIIVLGFILTVACVLNGCGERRVNMEKSFDSASINQIIIDAGDHPVVLQSTNGEDIAVSLNGDDKNIGKIEDKTLNLQFPPQSGVIHLEVPSKLIVGIPGEWNGRVEINSETGNVKADSIVLSQLIIKSDTGNVSLDSLSGTVSAKTDTGKIEVPDEFADKVKQGDLGETFEACVGDAGDNDNKISIYTITGNIKFK